VPVADDDTPERLHARIQQVEHELYPAALARLFTGNLKLEGRRTRKD
jgi:phosphoribosylglycinamide formyltransferase 1